MSIKEHIIASCKEVDVDNEYDEMIDEIYSFKEVGGPFRYLRPSTVLKEHLPTDYRCGKVDWLDSVSDRIVGVGDNYYLREEAEKARDEYISELEEELRKAYEEHGENLNEDAHRDMSREIDEAKAFEL